MIKLRDLIDEKKCGIGQNPEDTGCEPASGEKGKEKQDEKPKRKPLPGIGAPPHPDSPSQNGVTTKGPQSDDDAVGTDAAKERAIIAGVQQLVHDDRDVDLCKVSVPGSNLFCGGNKGIQMRKITASTFKI